MLAGLMGRISKVDTAAEDLPLPAGAWIRVTILPQGAGLFVGDVVPGLQMVVDNNSALWRSGAKVTGWRDGTVTIEGAPTLDWGRVGDFLGALTQIVGATVPHGIQKVEADIFKEVTQPSRPDRPPADDDEGEMPSRQDPPPATPTSPTNPTVTTMAATGGVSPIALIAGAALLFVVFSGKEGK